MLLHTAIQALRPNKEFTMYNDDPNTIVWNDSDVVTPTDAEIKNKYAELLAEENALNDARKEAKKALLEKLGLTESQVDLLLNNG
jgi:2C-methyl-D-erythritol 2,4-cyclodiphosphate synthase